MNAGIVVSDQQLFAGDQVSSRLFGTATLNMEYHPLDLQQRQIRLLTVLPPQFGDWYDSPESLAAQPVRCTLDQYSLNDLKPGRKLKGLRSAPLAEPQTRWTSSSWLKIPSVLATTFLVSSWVALVSLQRKGFPVPFRWLGLAHFYFYVALRAWLGGDFTRACAWALHRRYFNRWWFGVFTALYCFTTLAAVVATFTSWKTAVLLFGVGPMESYLGVWFQHMLEWIRFDINKIVLYEGQSPIPDARTFRFTWGDYVALSYACGDLTTATMYEIAVNEHIIKVGENLYLALRALRDTPEAQAGLKVWVDAISINQTDLQEKSCEVRRMWEIYANAWVVISWLGDEGEESWKAVELIENLNSRSAKLRDPTELSIEWASRYFGNGFLKSFLQFLRRRYWGRLWIIQELALGGDSVILLCGDRRVGWTEIFEAARLLEASLSNLRRIFESELGVEGLRDLSMLLWLVCQLHNAQPKTDDEAQLDKLDRLLRLAQSAAVFEERDRVYGLLGLLDPDISTRIIPDYSLSVRAIYVNFAKTLVESTSSLRCILMGSRIGLNEDWPSWVPDWTLGFDPAHAAFKVPYRASGDSVAKVTFAHKDEHMSCRGFRIGVVPVSKKAQPRSRSLRSGHQVGNEETWYLRYMSDLNRIVRSSMEPPGPRYNPATDDGRMEELIRPRPLEGPWQSTYEHNRSEAMEYFLHGGMAFDILMCRNLDRVWEQARIAGEVFESSIEIGQDRINVATVRKATVSTNDSVEAGDIICILFGCPQPVILRPRDGLHRVIGECFCHSVMQGEAMEWLASGEVQLEEFTLC